MTWTLWDWVGVTWMGEGKVQSHVAAVKGGATLVGPPGESAMLSWLVPGAWVPAVSLTWLHIFIHLHELFMSGLRPGPTSFSAPVTFPPSCFPSAFKWTLHCLFLGIRKKGGEKPYSLKMYLLNISVFSRHQSLSFPFSPYHIPSLRQRASNSLAAG